mmetsp:Transcript_57531/g.108422  ORF Transcript_57531/g.108422 Transcript_57531/m.108422 type:complete len:141 (-) Transcript_57531:14-436(-)
MTLVLSTGLSGLWQPAAAKKVSGPSDNAGAGEGATCSVWRLLFLARKEPTLTASPSLISAVQTICTASNVDTFRLMLTNLMRVTNSQARTHTFRIASMSVGTQARCSRYLFDSGAVTYMEERRELVNQASTFAQDDSPMT